MLRLSIGWHFATEGVYKIMSTPEGKNSVLARIFPITEGPTFTSEEYLRASTGPFAEHFRAMVPDVESRDKLNPTRLKEDWSAELGRITAHYGFDEAQTAKAKEALAAKEILVDDYFAAYENQQKIKKYFDDLAAIAAVDRDPDAMSYERERVNDARRSTDYDRRGLIKPIVGWEKDLATAWVGLATPEQADRAGVYAPPLDDLAKIDRMTMYGTTAVGFGLLLGFLTPIAALGGAAFLTLIYLSMPPFPGLPLGPRSEGHYVFVNKNLIELVACLALAATPSGLWFGIDAFLFGWIDRIGKRRAAADASSETETEEAPRASRRSKRSR
ncbi:MAG: DoxX family protein [Isosphaeraceae bacterium]|nr:DoxX family protein [Isosphaeraceae bacterium]